MTGTSRCWPDCTSIQRKRAKRLPKEIGTGCPSGSFFLRKRIYHIMNHVWTDPLMALIFPDCLAQVHKRQHCTLSRHPFDVGPFGSGKYIRKDRLRSGNFVHFTSTRPRLESGLQCSAGLDRLSGVPDLVRDGKCRFSVESNAIAVLTSASLGHKPRTLNRSWRDHFCAIMTTLLQLAEFRKENK